MKIELATNINILKETDFNQNPITIDLNYGLHKDFPDYLAAFRVANELGKRRKTITKIKIRDVRQGLSLISPAENHIVIEFYWKSIVRDKS